MTLNDLPESQSEFWDGEKYLRDIGKGLKHDHKFKMVTSRDIQCTCGFGLWIGEGDHLKDGDLYHEDKKVLFG